MYLNLSYLSVVERDKFIWNLYEKCTTYTVRVPFLFPTLSSKLIIQIWTVITDQLVYLACKCKQIINKTVISWYLAMLSSPKLKLTPIYLYRLIIKNRCDFVILQKKYIENGFLDKNRFWSKFSNSDCSMWFRTINSVCAQNFISLSWKKNHRRVFLINFL